MSQGSPKASSAMGSATIFSPRSRQGSKAIKQVCIARVNGDASRSSTWGMADQLRARKRRGNATYHIVPLELSSCFRALLFALLGQGRIANLRAVFIYFRRMLTLTMAHDVEERRHRCQLRYGSD